MTQEDMREIPEQIVSPSAQSYKNKQPAHLTQTKQKERNTYVPHT